MKLEGNSLINLVDKRIIASAERSDYMTKREFLDKISSISDDDELNLYVFDCEYSEEGYELGSAEFMYIEDSYVCLRVH